MILQKDNLGTYVLRFLLLQGDKVHIHRIPNVYFSTLLMLEARYGWLDANFNKLLQSWVVILGTI